MDRDDRTDAYFHGWNQAVKACKLIAEHRAGGRAFKRGAAVRIAEQIAGLLYDPKSGKPKPAQLQIEDPTRA